MATIVRQQEGRVEQAARNTAAARDEAAALRLQQRILTEYGRPDLALQLEPEAARKEEDARTLARHLADQEAALYAYRDYAARIGAPIGGSGGTSPGTGAAAGSPTPAAGAGSRAARGPSGQGGRSGSAAPTRAAPHTP